MSLSATPYLSSKERTKTEQIKILVIVRNLLCPNTLLRLTSSPANCDRSKFRTSFTVNSNFLLKVLWHWYSHHCTWIWTHEPGYNTILVPKMINENEANWVLSYDLVHCRLQFPSKGVVALIQSSLHLYLNTWAWVQHHTCPQNDKRKRSNLSIQLIQVLCSCVRPHFPWPRSL